MIGTIVNVITVAIGSTVGLLLRDKLPQPLIKAVFTALGLFTILIGIKTAFDTSDLFAVVISLVIGAVLGQALRLEERITSSIDKLKQKGGKNEEGKDRFAEGLVTAFILFCIGAMTFIGCLNEGLKGDRSTILTKSIMDLFSSVALASAFGRGVLFSIIPLFLYQGALTLGASWLEPYLTAEIQSVILGCGGILLIGLGLNILDVTKLKIINLAPSLLLAPLFAVYVPKLMDYLNCLFDSFI
jgi:uncharacterized membrane protein YqgA involved in biofilm formation